RSRDGRAFRLVPPPVEFRFGDAGKASRAIEQLLGEAVVSQGLAALAGPPTLHGERAIVTRYERFVLVGGGRGGRGTHSLRRGDDAIEQRRPGCLLRRSENLLERSGVLDDQAPGIRAARVKVAGSDLFLGPAHGAASAGSVRRAPTRTIGRVPFEG